MSSKAKISVGVIVVLILAFAGFKIIKGKRDGSLESYTPTIIKKGKITVQILSTGIVQPENKVEIKPPIAGRIEKVLVKEGDRVRKGQVLAWMSSTERAAMLDAASSKGAQELKDWEEMYRATPILAAINGTIIQKNVESGQTFTTQDAILVMSDRLTVKAQVDETDIAQIKLKQKAKLTLDAYPEQSSMAVVDQIAYDAKTINNVTTYVVDVLPEVAPAYMRSGMTANVTFDVASVDDVLIVPNDALKTEDGKTTVLIPNPNDNKAKPIETEVTTGLTDGKKTEIKVGLALGDTILIKQFKMSDKKSGGSNPFSPMGGKRPGKK